MIEKGQKAPDFSAKDQDGNDVSLNDFKGKKLVLYFYPADDTPGCTNEACNLRDNYDHLMKQGYTVVGVSADDEKSHKKFAEKYSLPFPLLVDSEHRILKAYDAWGEKTSFGKTSIGILRKTYIIDEQGKVEDIIIKVDTKNHTAQIMKTD